MITMQLLFRKRKLDGLRSAHRSQALLEFALALPILLALLFGIIDLAGLFQAWLTVENIARQTVRYAVTGQYDPAFCADGPDDGTEPCAGDGYVDEQDAARLLSIQEYADQQTIALFNTPGAAQDEIGHLNVVICSSRDDDNDGNPDFTFFEPNSPNYADCQIGGSTQHDAGGPGDRVIVAVDFNHPYITPFFNQVWPMTHLFAHRQGIVEQFRVPRLIALPPLVGLPTLTPSNTPLPTNTGTSTPTPTATITPLPLHIEIIVPVTDGELITDVDQTLFEAVTWDPNVGTGNGTGIRRVQFWFSGPGLIPGKYEYWVTYCAFGNSGAPCNNMDARVDHETLPSGTYTMYAQSESHSGLFSAVVSKDFILGFPATATPSNTPTPTITPSPTNTPVPSCSNLFINRTRMYRDDFQVRVRNNNVAPVILTASSMTWSSPNSPPSYYNFSYFGGSSSWYRYHDPGGKVYSSPINWSNSGGANYVLPGYTQANWGADFNDVNPQPLPGNFAVTLTFTYPGWGDCVLNTSITQNTPAPTNTPPPPTNTPLPPTPTDLPNIQCNKINASVSIASDDVVMNVTNNNSDPIALTRSDFYWDKNWSGMYVDWFRFKGIQYYNGNDSTPNTTNKQPNPPIVLNAGSSTQWVMDFDGAGGPIWGNFRVKLTFNGGQCVKDKSKYKSQPPPTSPPQPTNTQPPATNTPPPTATNTPPGTPTICFDC